LRNLASRAPFIALSAKSGHGLDAWLDWLDRELAALRTRAPSSEYLPAHHVHHEHHHFDPRPRQRVAEETP
jgi:hypothetical protein